MKKFAIFASLLLGLFLVLGVVGIAYAQDIKVPQGGAHLEVEFTQSFNHVVFTVTWVTDDPNGSWPFLFGDGTEYVLVGASGSSSFTHDYAYVPGGIISYYPSISLDGWTDPWCGVITIDDRHNINHVVFLPAIFKPAPEPVCSIDVSEYDKNHFVFNVTWQNAGSGVHQLLFGDGALTEQFSGTEGSGTTWHDYPYPGGQFIVSMNLSGGGSCSTQINVYWP